MANLGNEENTDGVTKVVTREQDAGTYVPQTRPGQHSTYQPLRRAKRSALNVSYSKQAQIVRAKTNPRRENILYSLLATGVMTRTQIGRLHWPKKTRENNNGRSVRMFLTKLYRDFVIDIGTDTSDLMRTCGMYPCHVYSVGPTGIAMVAIDQETTVTETEYKRRYNPGRNDLRVMHDILSAECFVQAIESARADFENGNEWDLRWLSERRGHIDDVDKELVRPDGTLLYRCQNKGIRGGLLFEIDRGSTEWKAKVEYYATAKARGNWRDLYKGVSEFPPILCMLPDRKFDSISSAVNRNAKGAIVYYFISQTDLINEEDQWLASDGNFYTILEIAERHG